MLAPHVEHAMGRALLASMLLACLLPLGAANVELSGPLLVQAWVPYTPQIHCSVLVTDSPSDDCHARAEAVYLTHLRARVAGSASVFAYVDKHLPDGTKVQLARLDCDGARRSCSVPLVDGLERLGTFELHVYVTGGPGALVSVDLEQAGPVVLP